LGIFISLTLNTCLYVIHFYEISGINSLGLVPIMQRAIMSANKRTTIRFQELNQKKYRTPLIVTYSYLLISYPISVSSAGLQWV
jgi:hypothetical protein